MKFKIDEDSKELQNQIKERMREAWRNDLKHQKKYEQVLQEAAQLRMEKVKEYGEKRYEWEGLELNLWTIFSDINRKHQRFEMLIKNIIQYGDKKSVEKMRSDLLDLINYGAMGVQMIDYMIEKDII
jgi:hypothetical protein